MTGLLVMQRGHYPRTTGSTGTAGLDADPTEQEFVVKAVKATADLVSRSGWAVRTINADVPVNHYGGDVFLAFHCDGSTARSAHGASAGYQTREGASFAAALKAAYAAEGWVGFRPDNYTKALGGYYGVRNAVAMGNRRAAIMEWGFLTNPRDEGILQTMGPAMVARAVLRALGATVPTPGRPSAPPVVGGGATLRVGSSGDQVRQWQSILAGANLLRPTDIDGRFGKLTAEATKLFQRQLGIEADGVVGPDTRAATGRLLAWLSAQNKNLPVEPKYPGAVELGDAGWAVGVWQRALVAHGYRLVISNRADAAFHRAVVDWQRHHAPPLTIDGVAGPATWHSVLRA